MILEYLRLFSETFYNKIASLIDSGVSRVRGVLHDELDREILNHLQTADEHCKVRSVNIFMHIPKSMIE